MADKTIPTRDHDSGGTSRALLKFCRGLFNTSNLTRLRLRGCFCAGS